MRSARIAAAFFAAGQCRKENHGASKLAMSLEEANGQVRWYDAYYIANIWLWLARDSVHMM
jgi:hypothetical protein